jgi:hypothetical protein
MFRVDRSETEVDLVNQPRIAAQRPLASSINPTIYSWSGDPGSSATSHSSVSISRTNAVPQFDETPVRRIWRREGPSGGLVQSCRNLGFGARDYLVDIIGKLETGWPLRRIVELVPDRWALERGLLTQPKQASQ